MKLLFDHNLSYRLVPTVASLYPGSMHVRDVEMTTADDEEIWSFARQQGLTIVSKDTDFYQRSIFFGHLGNRSCVPESRLEHPCSTRSLAILESLCRASASDA
jgi:predicted nuclease of predicted toxin-antitoxin system